MAMEDLSLRSKAQSFILNEGFDTLVFNDKAIKLAKEYLRGILTKTETCEMLFNLSYKLLMK